MLTSLVFCPFSHSCSFVQFDISISALSSSFFSLIHVKHLYVWAFAQVISVFHYIFFFVCLILRRYPASQVAIVGFGEFFGFIEAVSSGRYLGSLLPYAGFLYQYYVEFHFRCVTSKACITCGFRLQLCCRIRINCPLVPYLRRRVKDNSR
jgi:hypothetical protein